MNGQLLKKERSFCIELRSRDCVNGLSMTKNPGDSVVIEGVLGELGRVGFTDGVVLEMVGSRGVLRVDLARDEIERPGAGGELQ